ncbi:uncharacterized protein LOC110255271 [Sus scrofa]|uniref:uncharacterized protein LOC110255271 n=1 Tax=Sus scrofa TaxID=9823 RepID=UPI000A2B49D6|nr:uncharacterized protein LOC110255271 [Sus scrofa]
MVGVPHQPSFCLPQSSRGGQRAHSKSEEKPVLQPVWQQKPEDPQVSRELSTEIPSSDSSEQKLGLQQEATVTFLFTLLSTAEPTADPEEDLEIQECHFLDKEDWGPQQTSKEMSHLHNICMRLRESLSSIQADNLALGEKLQDLPNSLYMSLKEKAKCILERESAVEEGAQGGQEGALCQPPGSQKAELVTLQPDTPRDHGDRCPP